MADLVAFSHAVPNLFYQSHCRKLDVVHIQWMVHSPCSVCMRLWFWVFDCLYLCTVATPIALILWGLLLWNTPSLLPRVDWVEPFHRIVLWIVGSFSQSCYMHKLIVVVLGPTIYLIICGTARFCELSANTDLFLTFRTCQMSCLWSSFASYYQQDHLLFLSIH